MAEMTLEEKRAQMSIVGDLLRELLPTFDKKIFWVVPLTLRLLRSGEDLQPGGKLDAPEDEFVGWLRAFVYYLIAIPNVPDVDPRAVADADTALALAGTTRAAVLSDGYLDEPAQERIDELVSRLLAECPRVDPDPVIAEPADMDWVQRARQHRPPASSRSRRGRRRR